MSSPARMRWRRSASRRFRSRPRCRRPCGATAPRGSTRTARARRLAEHQYRYDRQTGGDAVPAEGPQTVTADEGDEAAHHEQRHDEGDDEADGDVEAGIHAECVAVLPQVEH